MGIDNDKRESKRTTIQEILVLRGNEFDTSDKKLVNKGVSTSTSKGSDKSEDH